MDNPVFYALEADDLPSCPRDGVRIFTTPLVAEFLRALNGALGLIAIAFCVYFLACMIIGRGDDK